MFQQFVINADAVVSIDGLTLTHGRADSGGSAIQNNGILMLSHAALIENIHAAANFGTMTVSDSLFANNNGDGIYNSGDLVVQRSTFTGNIHGIDNASHPATVINSTFAGNRVSDRNGIGAGIANSGTLTIINSTFADNHEPDGGGAVGTHRGGTVILINTILADSGSSGNCFGTMIDGGHNLQFPDASCGDSIPLGDPMLREMANSGGSTPIMMTDAGSPAVGAGDTAACLDSETVNNVDQRGEPRLAGEDERCDIGAVESDAAQ